MNIPNIRLLNQQLVAPQFSEVHDMVSWMGMLQAQEYRMMRWAVGTRLKRPSMKAVEAAYNTGRGCCSARPKVFSRPLTSYVRGLCLVE